MAKDQQRDRGLGEALPALPGVPTIYTQGSHQKLGVHTDTMVTGHVDFTGPFQGQPSPRGSSGSS